jgi:hypothetical protein
MHKPSTTKPSLIALGMVKCVAALVSLIVIVTSGYAQTNLHGDPLQGQISFGFDAQNYNAGRTSQVGSIDATLRLLPRLTLEAVANDGAYFGERFGGGGGYITLKPLSKTYLTFGGIRNSHTSTTLAWAASFELGRLVYQSRSSAIRGVETDFNVTQRDYHLAPSAGVLLFNPRVVIYLPRDWTLILRGGAIRATIAGQSDWTPSGGVSLNVPVTRRLMVSPGMAFDSEPADVLQIQNISSRQFGSGVRFWLTDRTSLGGYYFRVLYGANHLADDSYGVSYALRF